MTRLVVDRNKPGIRIWNYGVTNWNSHYNSDSFKVSLIMFYLNMVDYPVFFPSLTALTLDNLPDTQGYSGLVSYHADPYAVMGCGGWLGGGCP